MIISALIFMLGAQPATVPVLEQALSRAKNINLTTLVIPGANHLFLKARLATKDNRPDR